MKSEIQWAIEQTEIIHRIAEIELHPFYYLSLGFWKGKELRKLHQDLEQTFIDLKAGKKRSSK